MKLFSILLVFFLPLSALAVNGSGNVSNVVTLGGGGTDTSPALQVPVADILNGTWFTITTGGATGAANFSPFHKNGTATAVPSGKSWYCYGPTWTATAANDGFQLSASTSAPAINAASLSGSPVYQNGAAAFYTYYSKAINTRETAHDLYVFTTGQFPSIQGDSAIIYAVSLQCQEK